MMYNWLWLEDRMRQSIHPWWALHSIFPQYVGDGIFITVFLLCRHQNQLTNLFSSTIIFYDHQTWALEKSRLFWMPDYRKIRKINYTWTKWWTTIRASLLCLYLTFKTIVFSHKAIGHNYVIKMTDKNNFKVAT